jgi:exodeoxyribonuclease VIII
MSGLVRRREKLMHLMIDIETLGTNSNSPVIQIGAVLFDHNNTYDEFSRHIRPNFELSTPDVDTLLFWQKQSIPMPLNKNALEFPPNLRDMTEWIKTSTLHGVWANSPAFDLVILNNLAKAYDEKLPFSHSLWRDCRTMFKIGRKLGVLRVKPEVPHDALSDARAQAESIIAISDYLTERGVNII